MSKLKEIQEEINPFFNIEEDGLQLRAIKVINKDIPVLIKVLQDLIKQEE